VQLQTNLSSWRNADRELEAGEFERLVGWPPRVAEYLVSVNDEETCLELTRYLQDTVWPEPLPDDEAASLAGLLSSPGLTSERTPDEPRRESEARPEDVSLELPDDIYPELLDGLLQELPGQVTEFSAAMASILGASGTLEDINTAQRIAHTVKGAANVVGVRGIANLTHHLEDILQALAKQETLPGRALSDTLTRAADCLEAMSEALLGVSPPPEDSRDVLQQVLDWANRIDQEGVSVGAEDARPQEPKPAAEPQPGSSAKPAADITPMLRVPAPVVDDMLRLVGETIIVNSQLQERINHAQQQMGVVHQQHVMLRQLVAELEHLIDIQDITSSRRDNGDGDDFDPLEWDQFNELHTCSRRLMEVGTDARETGAGVIQQLRSLNELMVDQGRLHRETQESVLRTRMVPVQLIVPRLQRSVRQASRLTAKEVELEVTGSDTPVDSDVLTGLVDPLMHVLRNAVDHGIEPPEERQAAGKPTAGKIVLGFVREGNHIVVRCSDDGAGMDVDAIRRAAVERGMLSRDDTLTESELPRVIFTPGFSTRQSATQVSGRGIGMDVVYRSILGLKGDIQIQSRRGRGCLVEMSFPVTLISTQALLVRVGNQTLAVSSRGIEQILYGGGGELRDVGSERVFRVDDEIYRVTPLEALLDLPPDRRKGDREPRPILLVQTNDGVRAVLVERVVDSRDLVVKNMGRFVPKSAGLVGATILGDGSIAPVLDLPELLQRPTVQTPGATEAAPLAARELVEAELPTALVVDDSLSARRALAEFVQDAGYSVRTAIDGLDAVPMIDAKPPDVLLVDLEMPRMNGLELTTHVRANAASRDLPVIMITSRSTEKHRHKAQAAGVNVYLTKPYGEEELLQHLEAVRSARR
jgi:chemosensory pili system protein ChpA (sensor histidine kinase/response regulator)